MTSNYLLAKFKGFNDGLKVIKGLLVLINKIDV